MILRSISGHDPSLWIYGVQQRQKIQMLYYQRLDIHLVFPNHEQIHPCLSLWYSVIQRMAEYIFLFCELLCSDCFTSQCDPLCVGNRTGGSSERFKCYIILGDHWLRNGNKMLEMFLPSFWVYILKSPMKNCSDVGYLTGGLTCQW